MKKDYKAVFGIIMIISGLILGTLNLGNELFLGFTSVGNWLIYIGVVSFIILLAQNLLNNKRIIDERMQYVANKTNRITFLTVIMSAFVIMIWDGISKINLPYSLFMSYYICGITMTHLITYKLMLRKH
ncbi:MAG: hypothetical protein WC307_02915 [Candidatus Nanoarchaeia archaeon]|jgi:uncharacterized membrane protein